MIKISNALRRVGIRHEHRDEPERQHKQEHERHACRLAYQV